MATFTFRCEGAEETIEARDLAAACGLAEAWVREGWTAERATFWVPVQIFEGEDFADEIKVAIEPAEPACSADAGHDWEEESIRPHGGGVIIRTTCEHCGVRRVHNTWATDRNDGEQGLELTRYEDPDDEIAA